jgi:hypothetical protein
MLNNELKYFYEKLLTASGVSKYHFGIRQYVRMNKIKKLFNEN